MRWIEFQESPEAYDPLDCFEKHLIAQLDKLRKKYKQPKFLFCKDERQSKTWRRKLFPEYKGTRAVSLPAVEALHDVLQRIVREYGQVLAADELEADDVAFLTVRKLREVAMDEKIVVITSDKDYLQMTDSHVTLVNGAGKAVVGSGDGNLDLWIKILMGDKSDNIPPITKGVGMKTSERLAKDPILREEFIVRNACQAQFELNKTLISMDEIPANLVKAFYDGNLDKMI